MAQDDFKYIPGPAFSVSTTYEHWGFGMNKPEIRYENPTVLTPDGLRFLLVRMHARKIRLDALPPSSALWVHAHPDAYSRAVTALTKHVVRESGEGMQPFSFRWTKGDDGAAQVFVDERYHELHGQGTKPYYVPGGATTPALQAVIDAACGLKPGEYGCIERGYDLLPWQAEAMRRGIAA
jgi:hypothetical protein